MADIQDDIIQVGNEISKIPSGASPAAVAELYKALAFLRIAEQMKRVVDDIINYGSNLPIVP